MDKNTLFELRPAEFERLCVEILKSIGFSAVEHVGGSPDHGVDIMAKREGRTVAVEVKHTRRLSVGSLEHILRKLEASAHQAQELLLVTSAKATPAQKAWIQTVSRSLPIRLLDQRDVLQVLNTHPNIEQAMISRVRTRSQGQRWLLRVGILGGLGSLTGSILSTTLLLVRPEKDALDKRIETVERAIGNLKNLEKYLTDIKDDMTDTERAARAIKTEYAKAKELQKLTDAQFDAVKSALRAKSWQQTAFDYVLGFILGIASSLTASVTYSRWKQRRALAQ